MSRCVLLLACGNPIYGNWAFNLAVSIHDTCPDMPVVIVTDHDNRGISEINHGLFNAEFAHKINLYLEDTKSNGIDDFMKPKTLLYQISEELHFEEILFLDVDLVILPGRNVNDFFDFLSEEHDFAISTRGCGSVSDKKYESQWLKSTDVIEGHPEFAGKTMYNVSSETMYWKKTPKVKKYWEDVEELYSNPGCKFKKFGFGTPDEIAHVLSIMKHDMKMYADVWTPHFWEPVNRQIPNSVTTLSFYGFSIGGNTLRTEVKRFYDQTVQRCMQRRGIKYWSGARSKREFIPDRSIV